MAFNAGQGVNNAEYTLTDEDIAVLIAWRVRNKALFTGRRNAALKGFEEFVRMRGLSGKIHPVRVKRKWENLKQKYKELKANTTVINTEGGDASASSWKWFAAMDEALGGRSCINASVLMDPSDDDSMVGPVCPREPTGPVVPVKKKKEPEWLPILRTMLEREEEKERMYSEREEKREREAQEREERRVRDEMEREERREKERLEREIQWEKEWQKMEERRHREHREREERREMERRQSEEIRGVEIRAREEKLMAILTVLMNTK